MCRGRSGFRKAFFIIPIVLAVFALVSFIVMNLWNGVLAQVVAVKAITFWQAAGILVLSKILFGGFKRGWHHHHGAWGRDMKEKWQNMTQEEREKFKQDWRSRCGMWKSNTQPGTSGEETK